jgi:hypothetical protein
MTEETELDYIISDLGGSFGRAGNMITRSRNNPMATMSPLAIAASEGVFSIK